jgi:hypothetical protein
MIDDRDEIELRELIEEEILFDPANNFRAVFNGRDQGATITSRPLAFCVSSTENFCVAPALQVNDGKGGGFAYPMTPSEAFYLAGQLMRMGATLMTARHAKAARVELAQIQTLMDVKLGRAEEKQDEADAA